jgi:hypothetical protein
MQVQLQQPMTIRIQQLSPTEVSITFLPRAPRVRTQEEIDQERINEQLNCPSPSNLRECQRWLRNVLTAERKAVPEIVRLGNDQGYSHSTIRRAAHRLGVEKSRNENNLYFWRLDPAAEMAQDAAF